MKAEKLPSTSSFIWLMLIFVAGIHLSSDHIIQPKPQILAQTQSIQPKQEQNWIDELIADLKLAAKIKTIYVLAGSIR